MTWLGCIEEDFKVPNLSLLISMMKGFLQYSGSQISKLSRYLVKKKKKSIIQAPLQKFWNQVVKNGVHFQKITDDSTVNAKGLYIKKLCSR